MYNKKVAFLACCVGIFFFGAGMTTLGSILPLLMGSFGIDAANAGTLFTILPFGILLGALVFGPLSDRYGYRLLLVCCCLLMAAGFAGIAFSGQVTMLQLSVFIFGVGGGAMNGATSAAVSDMTSQSKGGNLSLLGLFFGIGAGFMPFIIGSLEKVYTFQQIVAAFAVLSFAVALVYLVVAFPPAKTQEGFSITRVRLMIKERLLLLAACFLFCQSSFEAVMNNWTATYLVTSRSVEMKDALFALSLHVAGYTLMRLLLGTVLRNIKVQILVSLSLAMLLVGSVLLVVASSYLVSIIALIFLGAGLAGGFPLMLAIVGQRYAQYSGTAFSFVFAIALAGNMILNYSVGQIAETAGLGHLPAVITGETITMIILALFIFKAYRTTVSR